MKKIKKLFAHKIFKILKWAFLVLIGLYLILVIVRVFHFINLDKTNAQIEKIHNTRLTVGDVMGKDLPPDPGALANKTVQGIDANHNGIRDDVELAIFKKYPDSAKTRAGLLQYALALQMETTQPLVNTEIVTEVIREDSRADSCVTNIFISENKVKSLSISEKLEMINLDISFVKDLQFNTKERKEASNSFYKKLRSFSDIEGEVCDIDYSQLSN